MYRQCNCFVFRINFCIITSSFGSRICADTRSQVYLLIRKWTSLLVTLTVLCGDSTFTVLTVLKLTQLLWNWCWELQPRWEMRTLSVHLSIIWNSFKQAPGVRSVTKLGSVLQSQLKGFLVCLYALHAYWERSDSFWQCVSWSCNSFPLVTPCLLKMSQRKN